MLNCALIGVCVVIRSSTIFDVAVQRFSAWFLLEIHHHHTSQGPCAIYICH